MKFLNAAATILAWQPYKCRYIFSPDNRIGIILLQRLFSIRNLLIFYLLRLKKIRKRTQNLASLEGRFNDRKILIIANGKSVCKVNGGRVRQSQLESQLITIGINYSPIILSELGFRLDYLVLSDWATHPRNSSPHNLAFWKLVRKIYSMKLITPESWCDPCIFSECSSHTCLHFIDIGCEGLSNRTSPLRPRFYPSLTAMKALAIAELLSKGEKMIIGYDTDYYKGLTVTADLQMIEYSHHFSPNQYFEPNVTSYWPKGVSDYFYFVSLNFRGYKKYFSKLNFKNLDCDSLVDAFEKYKSESNEDSYIL